MAYYSDAKDEYRSAITYAMMEPRLCPLIPGLKHGQLHEQLVSLAGIPRYGQC